MRISAVALLLLVPSIDAFTGGSYFLNGNMRLASKRLSTTPSAVAASDSNSVTRSAKDLKKQQLKELIRKEGGRFAFNTKYGALNPFAIYYGIVAILLGIPWFFALLGCQLFYFITGNRLDKQRRIPITITQAWGVTLMRLTRMWPKMENMDVLRNFYNEKRPAMFVANHNSWMDIPFLGGMIGWRNYKLISKKELGRVPILGKAIKVGGNIMVDRSDPRSQLKTLKKGIQYLKVRRQVHRRSGIVLADLLSHSFSLQDGVHLCTYPEGTRSRTGKLMNFKNGAFKMAHKAGAPVIPVSIVAAAEVMPAHWMFPCRPAYNIASIFVHEPVESMGKTQEELAAAVRKKMISGLPTNQRPDGE